MKNKILILVLLITSFYCSAQKKGLIPYNEGDFWGYCDTNGVVLINPIFEKADFFIRDQARIILKGKIGYIDEDGNYLLSPNYNGVKPYYNSKTYEVEIEGKHGVIRDEKVLIPIKFDSLKYLVKDVYLIGIKDKLGVKRIKNNQIEEVIPIKYDEIKYTYWNKTFKCFIGDSIIYLGETGQEKTHLDEEEDEIAEAAYHDESLYQEKFPQFISFENKGKKGLIIKNKSRHIKNYGQILFDTIPAIYDSINYKHWFSDCFVVQKNGKWGAINLNNQIYIPIEYEDIDVDMMSFQSSRPYRQKFKVKKKGKWGLIGSQSNFQKIPENLDILIPFEYLDISRGTRHYIVTSKKGSGVIIKKGLKKVTEPKYFKVDSICESVNGFYVFFIEDKNGVKKYVGQNGVEYFK